MKYKAVLIYFTIKIVIIASAIIFGKDLVQQIKHHTKGNYQKNLVFSTPTHLSLGKSYHKRGNYFEAIRIFDEIISIEKEHAEAYKYRGDAKRGLNEFKAALVDYEQAKKLRPKYVDAHFSNGDTKLSISLIQEAKNLPYKPYVTSAISDFDAVIRINSNHDKAYSHRGYAKYKLGQYFEAIRDFDNAIRLNPNSVDAYYFRGLSKQEMGHDAAGEKDIDKSFQISKEIAEQ